MRKRLARIAADLGRPEKAWIKDAKGKPKAQLGALFLDYAACYGGYYVEEIMNEGGGIKTWTSSRLSAREMDAFLDGFEYARRLTSEMHTPECIDANDRSAREVCIC